MNENQATNHKFTALLILLLCLFVPDLRLHSKHEGYLRILFTATKRTLPSDFPRPIKLSNFKKKILKPATIKRLGKSTNLS